ncbi:electron transporter, putative (Protein of unknown function, DUF547) [Thalictrum thalictroides]|uniref:Ternary complex factor MIP1 leucine-zipper domain-containing protein n=1 Tax=Thalictrum thalictroides TaxID=46969 RepID=A0A7J6WIA5_THATH|nr:electron transporter, putative (Protein of unknown function, DUF547) [Thalictrum thalictroides]
MDVNLDEKESKVRRRNDDKSCCKEGLDDHGQHRRSKSASDWNLDAANPGVSNRVVKNPDVSHDVPTMERSSRGKSPLHGDPHGRKTDMSSNHRASLEKDIEELHLRLQQEKTMRMMLERAMGRVSSTLSPGHRNVAVQV